MAARLGLSRSFVSDKTSLGSRCAACMGLMRTPAPAPLRASASQKVETQKTRPRRRRIAQASEGDRRRGATLAAIIRDIQYGSHYQTWHEACLGQLRIQKIGDFSGADHTPGWSPLTSRHRADRAKRLTQGEVPIVLKGQLPWHGTTSRQVSSSRGRSGHLQRFQGHEIPVLAGVMRVCVPVSYTGTQSCRPDPGPLRPDPGPPRPQRRACYQNSHPRHPTSL